MVNSYRCTEKVSCDQGSTSYGWLSYLYQACHAISMTTPDKISIDDVTKTEVMIDVLIFVS